MEKVIDKLKVEKYSSYKDSGIEWSGLVPENWEALPIRAIFEERNEKNEGRKTDYILSVTKDRGVIPYDEKGAIGNNKSEDIERYKLVYPNDFVINKMNVVIGSLGMSKYFGAFSQVYLVYKPRTSQININYYSYIFSNPSFYKSLIKYCTGIMELRESLNKEDFKKLILPFPDYQTQTAIVEYLDRKTVLINQAIGIKQKQIELLKERRQILIHKAVTRGLNPSVKMKDSGVEWIGEVPEGWEALTKMKYISSLKGRQGWQGLKVGEYKEEGPHVLSSAHFNNYLIDWDKCPRVSIERYFMDKHIQLNIGDILLMKDGANMGKLALIDDLPGLACLNSHLLLFRSLGKNGIPYYTPKFMFYHMMCHEFQDYVKVNGTGSTFLGISQESIGNYPICLPLIEEQKLITEFLDKKSSEFDKIISFKKQEIEKLKEYKATLINSAVTGKIKVC